jgi:pyrimidine-nucleoside phosphorylase
VDVLRETLRSGKALDKFRQFVVSQGGNDAFIDDLSLLPQAPVRRELKSKQDGYLASIDAEAVGRASVEIGAGRAVKGATIDHAVGFVLPFKTGDALAAGDTLVTVHAASDEAADAILPHLERAFRVSDDAVDVPPVILDIVQ